jgi:hypothetical protein
LFKEDFAVEQMAAIDEDFFAAVADDKLEAREEDEEDQ